MLLSPYDHNTIYFGANYLFKSTNRGDAWTRLGPDLTENEWRDRALVAEARAENATALARTRLLPSMARSLMSGLVQRLLLHRSDLLNSQQRAEQEVAELEQRLENLHTPLAGRLAAYEQRIAELEKELAAKGEENRELLRARIATARRKLVSEREREPVPLED